MRKWRADRYHSLRSPEPRSAKHRHPAFWLPGRPPGTVFHPRSVYKSAEHRIQKPSISAINDGKIADIFRDFKLGSRQHDAFGGIELIRVRSAWMSRMVALRNVRTSRLERDCRPAVRGIDNDSQDSPLLAATSRVPIESPASNLSRHRRWPRERSLLRRVRFEGLP